MKRLFLSLLAVVVVSVVSSATTYALLWAYQNRGVAEHNRAAFLTKLREHLSNAEASDLLQNETPIAADRLRIVSSKNLPAKVEVLNAGEGGDVMAEFRAAVDGCAANMFATGDEFSDNSNFRSGEAGVTAESNCEGLHIRSNGDGYVRVSVGDPPREAFRVSADLAMHLAESYHPDPPKRGGKLYVREGDLFFLSADGVETRLTE